MRARFSQGQSPALSGTELSAPLVVWQVTQPLSPCGTAPLKGEPFLGRESCGERVRTEGMQEHYTKKLISRARKMRGRPHSR